MSVALKNSPAEVVRALLISGGLGVAGSYSSTGAYSGNPWPVSDSGEVSSPDNCITVTDTQGVDHGRTMFGELVQHFGIQVRIRSVDHTTGYIKAAVIRLFLSESVYREGVAVGSNVYMVYNFAGIGQVLPIGKDSPKTKRSIFTLNAKLALREII